jgi:hypothetical protein
MAQSLDYQAPQQRPKSPWPRRYLVLVSVVTFSYIAIYAIDFVYELHHLDNPNWIPSSAYTLFGKIVCFPLLDVFGPVDNFASACILAVLNALLCGFFFAGCAHGLSILIGRPRKPGRS